jgi:hypothetical protein
LSIWPSLTATLTAGLALAVLEGALFAVLLVLWGTGAAAARSEVIRATSDRITALNHGRPIGFGQLTAAFAADIVMSSIDPRRVLRQSDIQWARGVQKQAEGVLEQSEIMLIYQVLQTAAGRTRSVSPRPAGATADEHAAELSSEGQGCSSMRSVAELAALPLAEFLGQVLPGIRDAESIGALRTAHRRAARGLVRFCVTRLLDTEYRWTWMNLGIALGDAIGRGTALSLLVAVLVTRDLSDLGAVLSVVSLGGGVLGALAFAARLLTNFRNVEDAIGRKRTVVTRQPIVTVVVFPLVVGALATGAPALGTWIAGLTGTAP